MRGDKREAILRAFESMLRGRRYHEVTLDDVARAAKVSKGTIYTYFRDKETLFLQLAAEGHDELCELVRARARGELPFPERMLAVCREISGFFLKRKPLMRVMLESEGRAGKLHRQMKENWKSRRLRMVAAVAETLEAGIGSGHIRPDVPAQVLAELLLGMLRARGRRLAEEEEELFTVEQAVDVFLNGACGARK